VYELFLGVHSLLRWVVLGSGVLALLRSLVGWIRGSAWEPMDERLGKVFLISLHVQWLLGAVLYLFLSPVTTLVFEDSAAALASKPVRYFLIAHPVMMFLAVIAGTVARVRSKKPSDPVARHRIMVIGLGIWLILTLGAIPWPGTKYGRPLLRAPG